jgi:hypothetical protein
MAKSEIVVKLSWASDSVLKLVSDRIGVEILDKEAFSDKINGAMVDFIIPRLFVEQMKIDGIIKVK